MCSQNNPCLYMQEDKFAKKALQVLGAAAQEGTLPGATNTLVPAPDRNKGKFLFDLVRLLSNVADTFGLTVPTQHP